MRKYTWVQSLVSLLFLVAGVVVTSCTRGVAMLPEQENRVIAYAHSPNERIAAIFYEENVLNSGIQPALTQKELNILDELVGRIDLDILSGFDQRFTAWLDCWIPHESIPVHTYNVRQLLKCNGKEFQQLVEFCRMQDDSILLLLYQLAARARCPYDQLLLHPAHDLLENFPEFNACWQDVNRSLQNEKPNLEDRTCNESTIWHIRKILEAKYGYPLITVAVTAF
jgi:hypothetical protein